MRSHLHRRNRYRKFFFQGREQSENLQAIQLRTQRLQRIKSFYVTLKKLNQLLFHCCYRVAKAGSYQDNCAMYADHRTPCDTGSPLWLIRLLDFQLHQATQRLVDVARYPQYLKILEIFTGLGLIAISWVGFPGTVEFSREFVPGYGKIFFSAFQLSGLTLVAGSLFFERRSLIHRNSALTFLFSGGLALAHLYLSGQADQWTAIAANFTGVFCATFILTEVFRRCRLPTALSIFILASSVVYFLPALTAKLDLNAQYGPQAFVSLLSILPVLVWMALGKKAEVDAAITPMSFAFSPFFLVSWVYPLTPEALPRRGSRIPYERAAQGLCQMLGGTLILIFATIFAQYLVTHSSESTYSFLLHGWTTYLLNYYSWLGLLHLGVGLARWFGFNLGAPAYYSILATNLIDRWKRWNFYFYWFQMTFVWLPVARRTGSIALAIAAVFALFFFIHTSFLLNSFLLPGRYFAPDDEGLFVLLYRAIPFYILQAAFLYGGFRLRNLWPKEDKFLGWLGVLMTHFAMSVCFGMWSIHW